MSAPPYFQIQDIKDLPFVQEPYRLCLANKRGDTALVYFQYAGEGTAIIMDLISKIGIKTRIIMEDATSFNEICEHKQFLFDHYRVYNYQYITSLKQFSTNN